MYVDKEDFGLGLLLQFEPKLKIELVSHLSWGLCTSVYESGNEPAKATDQTLLFNLSKRSENMKINATRCYQKKSFEWT